jgi:Tol biopolymer transport system component
LYRTQRRISRVRIGALILFVGLILIAFLAAPRVVDFTPSDEQPHIPVNSPIRIRFNTLMDRNSVESRLTIQPEVQGTGSWEGNTLTFKPRSTWPQGETVTVGLEAGARSVAFLPILSNQSWSFSVDNPNLLFISAGDGVANLNIYDIDRGEINPLTRSENGVLDYSMTFNRTKLVYDQRAGENETEIRALELATGEDELILTCQQEHSCRQATLSPDETFLAYVQYPHQEKLASDPVLGPGQVWLLPIKSAQAPYRLSDAGHDSDAPLWSASNQLAFYDATTMSIEILQIDPNGNSAPVHSVPNELELLGSWSPDGRYLAFSKLIFPEEGSGEPGSVEGESSSFFSHIYRLDTLTGNVIDLTSAKLGLVEDALPVYSPDGGWIAFSRKYLDNDRWDLGRQLWLMDSNGQGQRALSDASIYAHSNFAWDPNGDLLASMRLNQSDPTQAVEIWLFDIERGRSERLLESGVMPDWVP